MSIETALTALDSTSAETSATKPTEQPKVESKPKLEDILKPAPKPEEKVNAERFAALARKERGIVKQSQELKAREEKLAAEAKKLQDFDSYKQQGKYLEALQLLGISYEDLTSFVLNGQRQTPDLEVKAIKTEFEKYKQQQEDNQKAALERQAADARKANESAINDFRAEASEFLQTNKDTYELINMHGAQNIVLATIEQHYINSKKVMSLKEASDLVEDYLADQVQQSIKTVKRFQKNSDDKGQAKESQGGKTSPTLSNALTSSATPSLLSPQTEADRMSRAMAALNKAS